MRLRAKYSLLTFRSAAAAVVVMCLTGLLSGCNTTGCTDNRSSLPLAGFYSVEEQKAISIDSISIGGVGAPNDSLLLDCQQAGAVYLPFRQTASTASFFIAYKQKALDFPELVDTVTFNYDPIKYFASEECGAMLRYRIRRVAYTRHILDSVDVIPADSTIINVDIENLKFFFRTGGKEDEPQ